jgi:hypothetical protein
VEYLALAVTGAAQGGDEIRHVGVRATADQAIAPSSRSLALPSAKHRFSLVKGTIYHLRLPPLEVPIPAG